MVPAPTSVVSNVAWFLFVESLPPLVTKVRLSGRLSGLLASQVTVELSPVRTLVGAALQVILGALPAEASPVIDRSGVAPDGAGVAEALNGGISGAPLTSICSMASPAWMSSRA